jgi:beta-xylosidase
VALAASAAILTPLLVLAHSSLAQRAEGTELFDYTWMDGFDTPVLHSLWSWQREDPSHWSLDARPGFLRITTQTGGVIGPGGDQNNVLLTPAPSGDYRITTRVNITPSETFQFAALQVYQDDDNYVQINRAYVGTGMVDFDLEVGGAVTGTQVPEPATDLYLRIVKQGSTYSGYYSLDGGSWTLVAEYSADLTDAQVGVGAANNLADVAEIPADFDFFQLEGDFPVLDKTWTDGFGGPGLGVGWAWVNEDAANWSLTARPGFLRIMTHAGGVGDKNLLFRPAPGGDFDIRTRLVFAPTSNFQIGGLVLYQDSGNYLILGRAYCGAAPPGCVGNGIYFDRIEGGEFVGPNFATSAASPDQAYLRLTREGSMCSGYYSDDGTTWRLIGRHTPDGAALWSKIGLTAARGGSIPADFDFFQLSPSTLLQLYLPIVLR